MTTSVPLDEKGPLIYGAIQNCFLFEIRSVGMQHFPRPQSAVKDPPPPYFNLFFFFSSAFFVSYLRVVFSLFISIGFGGPVSLSLLTIGQIIFMVLFLVVFRACVVKWSFFGKPDRFGFFFIVLLHLSFFFLVYACLISFGRCLPPHQSLLAIFSFLSSEENSRA